MCGMISRKYLLLISFFAITLYAPFAYADGVLGVTAISAEKTYAQADGEFAHGWKWTLAVTVPTNEPILQMKFATWTGSSTSFSSTGNVRFYSAQSSNADSVSNAITVDTSDAYGSVMNLLPSTNASFDLSTSTPGRQIQITVEIRVPSGTVGGSYTTTYGILTNPDTTPPVISLLGSPSVTIERTSVYTDAGATASDNIDGNISSNVVLSGTVTASSVGTYLLSYNVSDIAGNEASPVTRTVLVQDTIPPTATVSYSTTTPTNADVVATLMPSEPVTFLNTMGMATTTTGTATTSFAQNGDFTFLFADVANNTGSTTATVGNIDKTAPTLTGFSLNGSVNDLAVNIASTSVAISLTASEAVNWLSIKIENQTDTSLYKLFQSGETCTDWSTSCEKVWTGTLSHGVLVDGTYRIRIHARDDAGNETDSYLGKVIIVDTTAPVITMGGNSIVAQDFGVAYTDAGATANDARDGVVAVTVSGTVDVNTEGDYVIVYRAEDALHTVSTATRTVHVRKVPVTSVTVTGPGGATQGLTLNSGSDMQMLVVVSPGNVTNGTVFWDVYHHAGDAGAASIDQNGLLHGLGNKDQGGAGSSGGNVRARATATDGSGIIGEVLVRIIVN